MSFRFNRDYRLFIRFTETDVVEIKPPLRIQFEAKKTIISDINELRLKIYNLNRDKRNKLIKDKAAQGVNDKYLQVILQVGYDDLVDVFIGDVYEAGSQKTGADYITTLVCKDGGFDFRNSFTSKTIQKNVPTVPELLKDMPNTNKGKITKQKTRIRPKVMVGNTYDLIVQNLEFNETFFIDNEKLNVIKDDELIDDFAVEVSSETGLLNSPQKQETFIICETLMNPAIKCGGQVLLKSDIIELNDLYRVDTIEFKGDYRAQDWKQVLYMRKSTGFKVAE
jgi:hypothetical protein